MLKMYLYICLFFTLFYIYKKRVLNMQTFSSSGFWWNYTFLYNQDNHLTILNRHLIVWYTNFVRALTQQLMRGIFWNLYLIGTLHKLAIMVFCCTLGNRWNSYAAFFTTCVHDLSLHLHDLTGTILISKNFSWIFDSITPWNATKSLQSV